MISSPSATERNIPVFETLLEELDKRAAVLNETSYQISNGINRIWDNRVPENDEKESPMPNDVVGKAYYILHSIDKSIQRLGDTKAQLEKLV